MRSGRCACSAVRYESAADPVLMLECHCRDCQRASGGACTHAVVFPAAALTVHGEPRWWVSKADSGNTVRRGFCGTCGSPLFAGNDKLDGFVVVKAASLDDPSAFKSQLAIWTASAQPWAALDASIPHFAHNPPRPG